MAEWVENPVQKMHSPKQRGQMEAVPYPGGPALARHAALWNDPNVWQQLRPSLCKERVLRHGGSLSLSFRKAAP